MYQLWMKVETCGVGDNEAVSGWRVRQTSKCMPSNESSYANPNPILSYPIHSLYTIVHVFPGILIRFKDWIIDRSHRDIICRLLTVTIHYNGLYTTAPTPEQRTHGMQVLRRCWQRSKKQTRRPLGVMRNTVSHLTSQCRDGRAGSR